MTAPLLEARNLHRNFRTGRGKPPIRAVTDVGLTVRRGETLGLVGESGSGKSTVARMLVGLETPDSGTIRFDGRDIAELRRNRAFHRKIQFVFQDPVSSLNPRKTIRQILEAPLKHLLGLSGAERRQRAEALMARVHLRPEFLNRYPHELSGGQAQRVAIARALAAEPELIVLDEPVSALDVSIQAQILALLRGLKQDLGLAYVFISHDLAVVETLCDTVAVMYLGHVVEQASRDRLFRAPRHPYTRLLLASVPVPGGRAAEPVTLTGEPPNPAAPPPGCPFEPRCYRAEPVCRRDPPSLTPHGTDRPVACHFADDSDLPVRRTA
jgi:oligopeptide/dipeptide ABC transporter ATP-binding protein